MNNSKIAKLIVQVFWISVIVIFNIILFKINDYQKIYEYEQLFTYGFKEQLVVMLFSILLVIYIIYYYNQNNTNYKKQELSIKSILIFNFIAILLFFYSFQTSLALFTLFIFPIYLFVLVLKLIGKFKAYNEIHQVNKNIKKTNPYMYYRYLPNSFGIGVITLLFDSTLENEKDIVAVILDLCAKKYLSLVKSNDKYIIKVLKPVDDNLLLNEKYILNLIINNNLKNIDYKTWYKTCVNDGIKLGLYNYKETETKKFSLFGTYEERENIIVKICGILGVVLALLATLYHIYKNGISLNEILSNLGFFAVLIPFFVILLAIILKIINLIISFFSFIFGSSKDILNKNYKDVKDNRLIITNKGKEELQKLYSFKAFIKDFGNFAPKEAKEIVLWDRYLSYAQVFGLTKEIMQTGYKELVNNASFQIDNIDNINFNNIEILR